MKTSYRYQAAFNFLLSACKMPMEQISILMIKVMSTIM